MFRSHEYRPAPLRLWNLGPQEVRKALNLIEHILSKLQEIMNKHSRVLGPKNIAILKDANGADIIAGAGWVDVNMKRRSLEMFVLPSVNGAFGEIKRVQFRRNKTAHIERRRHRFSDGSEGRAFLM